MTRLYRCFVSAAVIPALGCSPQSEPSEGAGAALQRLVPLRSVDHLGGLAREPMVVETPDGTLFVTGYGEERPTLWRSADGGDTWEAVDVGGETDGAVGNSDVDLALGADGTLYFVAMSFDRQTFEGTGIDLGSSRDGGATWTWASLSRARFDDRPWVEVAPDGTAHAIWNDGAGVRHATSTDGGGSWAERPRIHTVGGSSHLAIGPAGAIAVRITPLSASSNRLDPGADHLALSTDGGESWTLRDMPGTRAWTRSFDPSQVVPRWVEPLAWDSAGALFALWSEGDTLWLARSRDQGAAWTSWPVIADSVPLYFPYLAARGSGELAATWYSGIGDSLRANLAYIRLDDARLAPRVARVEPFEVPAFRETDGGRPPSRDTAGEYLPVLFLHDGRIAVASTIQDPSEDRWGFTFRLYELRDSSDRADVSG